MPEFTHMAEAAAILAKARCSSCAAGLPVKQNDGRSRYAHRYGTPRQHDCSASDIWLALALERSRWKSTGSRNSRLLTSYVTHMGVRAVGVIDFLGVGGAAGVITIGGVSYTEADTADAPNGVWTNGADAAAGAASLVAAINGDTRSTAPPVTAVASDVADSVVVTADAVGKAGNLAMTTSAANTTVDAAMHGGEEPARLEVCIVQRAVDYPE